MRLIVDTEYRGHHSEYLDILTENPITKNDIFILNPNYTEKKTSSFSKKTMYYNFTPKNNFFSKVSEIKFINKIIKKHMINECILLNYNYYFNVLLFYKIKVSNLSSIYYLPHFFDRSSNRLKRILKNIFFAIIEKRIKQKIYLLNDHFSVERLNHSCFKSKFKFLPDPVVKLRGFNITKPIKKLNFLFIGEISERKGINVLLEVLEKIIHKPINCNFTIAGNAPTNKKNIASRINKIVNLNKKLIHYNKLDRISNNNFEQLISNADAILCLHQVTDGSSGIIGKAILHSKIVIGPNKGLMSKIISENKLGITTDVANPNKVLDSINYYIQNKHKFKISSTLRKKYLKKHSPNEFVKNLTNV